MRTAPLTIKTQDADLYIKVNRRARLKEVPRPRGALARCRLIQPVCAWRKIANETTNHGQHSWDNFFKNCSTICCTWNNVRAV